MGIADRDYYRQASTDRRPAMNRVTPVVLFLLISNTAIYFLDLLLASPDGSRPFRDFGVFTIRSALFEMRVWEFITFQFLHGSLGHLLANMLGIFFFGPWLERWWGSARFLIYYLICGAAGGLFYTALTFLKVLPDSGLYGGLLGASAGIYGILIGVAMVAPNLRVALLFPPIELSMRQLAMVVIAIAVGAILLKLGGNEGGEAGHLGGAIAGFIIMKFPQLLGHRRRDEVVVHTIHPVQPQSDQEREQAARVDAILDKISREGFQSLSTEEREYLQKVSQSK